MPFSVIPPVAPLITSSISSVPEPAAVMVVAPSENVLPAPPNFVRAELLSVSVTLADSVTAPLQVSAELPAIVLLAVIVTAFDNV